MAGFPSIGFAVALIIPINLGLIVYGNILFDRLVETEYQFGRHDIESPPIAIGGRLTSGIKSPWR